MAKKITVQNRRNGSRSEMTEQEFKDIDSNPSYIGVFKVFEGAEKASEPKEVTELKEKQKAEPSKAEPKIAEQPEAKKDDNGK